jgi:hypothetical protein
VRAYQTAATMGDEVSVRIQGMTDDMRVIIQKRPDRKTRQRAPSDVRTTADGKYTSVFDAVQRRKLAWSRLKVRRRVKEILEAYDVQTSIRQVVGGTRPTLCAHIGVVTMIVELACRIDDTDYCGARVHVAEHALLCSCSACN